MRNVTRLGLRFIAVTTSPERNIIRIEVPAEAKKKHATVPDQHGMTRVSVSSRPAEWFGKLELPAQNTVIVNYASGTFDRADVALF